jgi:hypothetical protein
MDGWYGFVNLGVSLARSPNRHHRLSQASGLASHLYIRRALAKILLANPSPTKQIQTKTLGFAWFYSFELGLFNGLQRFQIKILLIHLFGRQLPGRTRS